MFLPDIVFWINKEGVPNTVYRSLFTKVVLIAIEGKNVGYIQQPQEVHN